ncbi:MAG: hypothetical protein ISS26_01105 [Candidatus Omnitrophica bacterium]|nr:hypothetical protein [Candidatus Omnitrophota bacterium]
MRIIRDFSIAIFALIVSIALVSDGNCESWKSKKKVKKVKQEVIKQKKIEKKIAGKKYIQSHDVNNDGKVDLKDRLIHLRRNKGSYAEVPVSAENEGLYGVMDANSDSNVGPAEMERFYDRYDTNNDGLLEDEEIGAAVQ